MPAIQISIADKIAAVQGSPTIICGNSDYTVTFSFDSEWDNYTEKTCVFRFYYNGLRQKRSYLFTGASVAVPILHDISEVEIGVFAGNLHTTTPARVPCVRSITDGAQSNGTPPTDVYAQLMAYLAGMQGGAPAGLSSLHIFGADAGASGATSIVEEET